MTNPSLSDTFRHWQVYRYESEKICELRLDLEGKSQNVLSSEAIEDLEKAIASIPLADTKGLIISSGKSGGFIVGADVSEFQQIDSEGQALERVKYANNIIDRIESLTIPTVALINGHCFGGGLELALACDYRVISDQSDIRTGLPEVKLGIHPGFGGTVRLPELIGVPSAMDLILSGKAISPFAAKKLGMVDQVVPPRQLMATARFLILKKNTKTKNKFNLFYTLCNLLPVRHIISAFLVKQVSSKADPSHYPAPFAVIENWKTHGSNRTAMFKQEQSSISKLLNTATSRNLVKVFFLQEQLKQIGKQEDGEKYKSVHVVGAGVMGGDIAAWCALKGLQVTLHDRSNEALSKAVKRAHKLFSYKLKNKRLVERAMDRFHPDPSGNGARHADVIIEAIFENLEVKQEVFSALEKMAKPTCILASNTSSIPLESIAQSLDDPTRLVGLHFFNPVASMQLIEIVVGKQTAKQFEIGASSFANQIGRLPVPVKSSPGFLVNRVLMPYALEAVELIKDGVPLSIIDKSATRFGMPMGPVTLADTVGLDICLHVAQNLSENFDIDIPDLIKTKVDQGHLGKKSGKGFYSWKDGKPQKEKEESDYPSEKIEARLVSRYINECIACLDDDIVSNPDFLDAALIFGTGFSPFRGGPMEYIEEQGAKKLFELQESLHQEFGARFKPAAGWQKLL